MKLDPKPLLESAAAKLGLLPPLRKHELSSSRKGPASGRAAFHNLDHATMSEVANELDRSVRTIHRYQAHGLTPKQADQLAVALGYHPAELWGQDFYEGVDQ